MAKRRTKKDRIRSQIKNLDSSKLVQKQSVPDLDNKKNVQVSKIFLEQSSFIKKDLKKTLIVTLFILLVLFAIALLYT